MPDVVSRGTLFDPTLVKDLITKVAGKSSLIKLANQEPVAFNGNKYFTFTMDDEVNMVAENAAKARGGMALTPKTVVPIKVEYGARVSDEFMYGTEELKLDILRQFNEGYAKKVARGLDIMAMHRMNPRTATVSTQIDAANAFDTAIAQANIVEYDATVTNGANEAIEEAAAKIAEYADLTGVAMSRDFARDLAKTTNDEEGKGARMYPELRWGGNPGSLNGTPVDVNSTVSFGESDDKAIVGDFQNFFRWGIAKEIPLEVIQYGNPDNSEDGDLKGHNQVYLRAETYIGFAIMDPAAFAMIVAEGEGEQTEEQPAG